MNANYFILDALWLLSTQYTDFFHKDWAQLFNIPNELVLSKSERQLALNSMIENNLVWIDDGWCKLTCQGGAYWETLFQVNWAGFYDYWFESLDDNGETEQLDFYCSSEKIMNLFLKQHSTVLTDYQIEPLHNWNATYWKTLEHGFHLKQIVSSDFNQVGRIQLPKWKLELNEVIKSSVK